MNHQREAAMRNLIYGIDFELRTFSAVKPWSSGKEEQKLKSSSSLHDEYARINENVLFLKHTNTKHQLWLCSAFSTVPQTGQKAGRLTHSSQPGSCRVTASSLSGELGSAVVQAVGETQVCEVAAGRGLAPTDTLAGRTEQCSVSGSELVFDATYWLLKRGDGTQGTQTRWEDPEMAVAYRCAGE